MTLPLYQVDAFTDNVFAGNPAAVVPLKEWLPDGTLQSIAAENNLSETVFFVKDGDGFAIRWFTPNKEVNLCGHATLAAAFVIFTELGHNGTIIRFSSKSGILTVEQSDAGYTLDFPVWDYMAIDMDDRIIRTLPTAVTALYSGTYWVAVLEDEDAVRTVNPDLDIIKSIPAEGLVVTAKGSGDTDFVSRFFMPNYGIDEDPVTGSAHCILCPIWADRLGKHSFKCRQVSRRGGELDCTLKDGRVLITGKACLYLKGEISI